MSWPGETVSSAITIPMRRIHAPAESRPMTTIARPRERRSSGYAALDRSLLGMLRHLLVIKSDRNAAGVVMWKAFLPDFQNGIGCYIFASNLIYIDRRVDFAYVLRPRTFVRRPPNVRSAERHSPYREQKARSASMGGCVACGNADCVHLAPRGPRRSGDQDRQPRADSYQRAAAGPQRSALFDTRV